MKRLLFQWGARRWSRKEEDKDKEEEWCPILMRGPGPVLVMVTDTQKETVCMHTGEFPW